MLSGLLLAGAGASLILLAPRTPVVSRGVIPASDVGHGRAAQVGGEEPARLMIPSLDVNAVVAASGLTKDGTVALPRSYQQVGWWRGGAGMGLNGPVVLVGHIDSKQGLAVFGHLHALQVGASVALVGRAGHVDRFVVDAVRQYNDHHFPVDLVYGATARPTLRLLTCAGFSWIQGGHYQDNLVVFAHAV